MRPVRIDFARVAAPTRWLGWAVLVASVALTGVLVTEQRASQVELARLQDRARVLGGGPRPAGTGRDLSAEMQRARAVTEQLTLPWGPLFQAIESATTARVALLALQPDTEQGLVRITAETRDLNEALEFVRRLSQTRQLRSVHLDGHHIQTDNPMAPLRFTVVAGVPKRPRS